MHCECRFTHTHTHTHTTTTEKKKERMERVVIISDAEPDDLIALRMLLLNLHARKVPASCILVLATLRNARESANVLDKVIVLVYPELRSLVGTSNSKKAFTDTSGLLICVTLPRREPEIAETKEAKNGVDVMCDFVASANPRSVDMLVLAPPIDLNKDILARLSSGNIRGIWAWGGLPSAELPSSSLIEIDKKSGSKLDQDMLAIPMSGSVLPESNATSVLPVSRSTFGPTERKAVERKTTQFQRQIYASDVCDKLASFNWRSAPAETAELLKWSQRHRVPYTIATPAVYRTTSAWANFVGVTEDNNPTFVKLLREKPELALIRIWIQQWNEICPEAVKLRCKILPGSLQFTPADPVAVAVYLWPESIIAAQELVHFADVENTRDSIREAPSSFREDSSSFREAPACDYDTTLLGDATITFVNAINYEFFVEKLCEL
jgi:hypothetical protein